MTKKEALQVMLDDKESHPKSLNWAVNYIKSAIHWGEDHPSFDELVIRILTNATGWRHPKAKEVRATLRS